LHWVSAEHAIDGEVRLYNNLFANPNPGEEKEGMDFISNLNPNSLEVLHSCKVEPNLAGAKPGDRFQFLRMGYFCVDPDSTDGKLVFNRIAALKDTWAKVASKE